MIRVQPTMVYQLSENPPPFHPASALARTENPASFVVLFLSSTLTRRSATTSYVQRPVLDHKWVSRASSFGLGTDSGCFVPHTYVVLRRMSGDRGMRHHMTVLGSPFDASPISLPPPHFCCPLSSLSLSGSPPGKFKRFGVAPFCSPLSSRG
jgi:hypothetical protein